MKYLIENLMISSRLADQIKKKTVTFEQYFILIVKIRGGLKQGDVSKCQISPKVGGGLVQEVGLKQGTYGI